MPSENKIAVVIEGGVLQSIFWNGPGMPDVHIVDWDEDDEASEKENTEFSEKLTPANGWKEVF